MQEWLVRSSGEIKGPYELEELAEAIYSQEVGLLDEVCKTLERWTYVREHPELRKAVEKVRERIDQHLDRTQTNVTHGITQTMTLTGTEEIAIVTPSISNQKKDEKPSIEPESQVFFSVERRDSHRQFEAKHNPLQIIRLVGAAVILVVGVFLGVKGWESKKESENVESRYQNMVRWAKLDLGRRAFEEYRQIKSQKQIASEDQWLLAPWLLKYEMDTAAVQAILQKKVEENSQDNSILFRANLGFAYIAHLKAEDDKTKRFLNQAQTLEPRSDVPKINQLALMLSGKTEDIRTLSPADLALASDLEFMMAGLVAMKAKKFSEEKYKNEYLKVLEQKISRPNFIRNHLLLVKALIQNKVASDTWQTPLAEEFEYKVDPFIFPEVLEPQAFFAACKAAENPEVQILCSLNAHKTDETEKQISEWSQQGNQEIESMFARGHLFQQKKSWNELSHLAAMEQIRGSEIASYWRMLACRQENLGCEEDLKRWSDKEPKQLETQIALASLYKAKGREADSKAMIKQISNQLPERADLQEALVEEP